MKKLRLGVNIDHVATIRNARGGQHPDPVRAAQMAHAAGAHGITAHLREDRRHVIDNDIFRLKYEVPLPLNMEMAATQEMLQIALQVKPNACCIVPEKRTEVTTEGGLDVVANKAELMVFAAKLKDAGIRVSLFIDPEEKQVEAALAVGADIVELHTGAYCNLTLAKQQAELQRIIHAAGVATNLGIECHAGHGLSFSNVAPIAAIGDVVELNIGHFLIGEAVFIGLEESVKTMLNLMKKARG